MNGQLNKCLVNPWLASAVSFALITFLSRGKKQANCPIFYSKRRTICLPRQQFFLPLLRDLGWQSFHPESAERLQDQFPPVPCGSACHVRIAGARKALPSFALVALSRTRASSTFAVGPWRCIQHYTAPLAEMCTHLSSRKRKACVALRRQLFPANIVSLNRPL